MGGSPEVAGTVGRRSRFGCGPLRPGPITDARGARKTSARRPNLPGLARRAGTWYPWSAAFAGRSLLLAQIRELQGNLDEARKEYRTLLGERPTAAQLAIYTAFLLRHGPAAEADQRLKQLEKLRPEDLATLELRVRWLREQKRTAEVEPLVEGVVEKLLERGDKDPTPHCGIPGRPWMIIKNSSSGSAKTTPDRRPNSPGPSATSTSGSSSIPRANGGIGSY